ncbi:MAG: class I SAM-dependent methyltransferase [Acidimicrobiia bacterium]
MTDFPVDFVADLRSRTHWPALEDSLWRSPALVDLTHGRIFRLVTASLPPAPARILDVGCGAGALSLEVARLGHLVDAVDSSQEAIGLARRGTGTAAPGKVSYHLADVADFPGEPATYDAAVVSRTLHHLPNPAETLRRIRDWLRPGGLLVCVDFAHDLFDRRAGRWLALTRGLLEAGGLLQVGPRLPEDPESAVGRVMEEWAEEHQGEDLNPFEVGAGPLGELFREHRFAWLPYLYWDLLEGLRVSGEQERPLGSLLASWEEALIAAAEIPAVLFLFVGLKDRV